MVVHRSAHGHLTQNAVPTTEPAALELRGISHAFGTVAALDDVSFLLRAGSIHALLGENGAGKSTLMRAAYGMLRQDGGEIRVAGKARQFATPLHAIADGIGMVHQHFSLVPAMTVAENLALGRRGSFLPEEASERVRSVARRTGFDLDPDARVETLSVGAQQRVEIAKALSRDARILILDEPTAVLAPGEVDDLLGWLREFARNGAAVVIITHKLREALAIADDVTVLRKGRVTFSGPASTASIDSLTVAMVGEQSVDRVRSTGASPAPRAIVQADDVTILDASLRARIRNASFRIHSGEVLGVAGVEGAGHRELLRAVAGRRSVSKGVLTRPEHAGFIPDDRHRDAVLLHRSLTENVVLRDAGSRRGVIDWSAQEARTQTIVEDYDVRAPHPGALLDTLSGGNQQKLVVGRELSATAVDDGQLIVAENPTRGLDIRATAAVHARLLDARDQGAAVMLYSSDLDEVMALATRMLVVFDGTVRELPLDRDRVARAMLGLA